MGKNNFRKIATITLFESAVQWYCFLLYGTAAGTVFYKVFFSQTGNGTTALILSYMSFALAAGGRIPMIDVEIPIINKDAYIVTFRPFLSPICPKKIAPNGPAIYPIANDI